MFEVKRGRAFERLAVALASLAISLLFLLVFSYYTSPLSSSYGYDAAFFQLVGSGLLDGYVPYRDFFDMKGPVLFFMEALGQGIVRGRIGAFIVQCACLTVTLAFVFEIMRLAGGKRWFARGLAGAVAGLLLLAFTIEGGNLTEELSLPFTMAVLYISLRYFIAHDKGFAEFKPVWAVACGVVICALALIRVTNAAMVLSLLACVAIVMLIQRQFKLFAVSLAWMVLGFVVPFALVCCFYAANGTLGDLLYCVFQFGSMYAGELTLLDKVCLFAGGQMGASLLVLAMPVVATALRHGKFLWCWLVSVLCPIAVLLAICMGGREFLHYVGLAYPVVILGLFLVMLDHGTHLAKWRNVVAAVAAAVLFVCACVPFFYQAVQITHDHVYYHFKVSEHDPTYADVDDIAQMIPSEEADSVYCYGDYKWSQWYAIAQLYPCIRYMDWQPHYLKLEPRMREDLVKAFKDAPPKWLVVLAQGENDLPDFISEALDEKYRKAHGNDSFDLYRLTS